MDTPEAAYPEDDTPRRFKELLQQATAARNRGASVPPKGNRVPAVDDEWVVRPGESFREFNARIRQSGLSVPPGVSEATRYPREPRSERQVRETVPAKRFAAPELPSPVVAPGERTKQKRREYLKQRREVKKLKKHRSQAGTDSDDDGDGADAGRANPRSLLHTRDVVQAPPALKVTPKATLKITQQRPPHRKNPSLLPILRAAKRT